MGRVREEPSGADCVLQAPMCYLPSLSFPTAELLNPECMGVCLCNRMQIRRLSLQSSILTVDLDDNGIIPYTCYEMCVCVCFIISHTQTHTHTHTLTH